MHQALYRKWRPDTFDKVVGQEHITNVLKYEVANKRVSHAYLFCGSRGTGKTTCAKILSKAANCLSPIDGNPCGKCEACRLIESGAATDILEMDAASNTGVDYIRDIRDEVVYAPSMLTSRVYIIDEVHMLTDSAFNALLKTLEEPPENVIFILATTEMQKIPATILSRCQRFDFRRLPTATISSYLMKIAKGENIKLDEDASHMIARLASGGMRDAISLLDLCSSQGMPVTAQRVEEVSGSAGAAMVYETVQAIAERNSAKLFSIVASIYMSAKDIGAFWVELMNYYRDMLVLRTVRGMEEEKMRLEILDMTEAEFASLKAMASRFRAETLLYHGRLLEDAYVSTIGRAGEDKRLCAEMTLARLCAENLSTSQDALLARIGALEEKLSRIEAGAVMAMPSAAAAVDDSPSDTEDEEALPLQSTPEEPPVDVGLPIEAEESAEEDEFVRWSEVVEYFASTDRTASSFLVSATAYKSGSRLTIKLSDGLGKSMIESRKEEDALLAAAHRVDPDITEVKMEIVVRNDDQRSLFDDLF